MRIPAFTMLALIVMCFASFMARADELPEFSDYKIIPTQYTQVKSVNLKSHPDAPMYRTRLREGFKKPANLAGRYVVITHGCGSSCQVNWIVNKENGNVIDAVGTTFGLGFRIDSNLLIANPLPETDTSLSKEDFAGYEESYKFMVKGPRYYTLENDKLNLILDNSKTTEKTNR